MKCDEINIIAYIEGTADDETAAHIKACSRCRKLEANTICLLNKVIPQYAIGKKIQLELEKELATINAGKMKPLPLEINTLVKELHEQRLISRVRKVIGNAKKNAGELIENIFSPQFQPFPASPKDIARSRKSSAKSAKVIKKRIKKSKVKKV